MSPKQLHIPVVPEISLETFAVMKLAITAMLNADVTLVRMPRISIAPMTISVQGNSSA
jgi:hypothetical protein